MKEVCHDNNSQKRFWMEKRNYFTNYFYEKLELKFSRVAFVCRLKEKNNPEKAFWRDYVRDSDRKGVSRLCPFQPAVMRGHQVENYNIMSTLRRRQHTHERNGGNVLVNGMAGILTRFGINLMDLLFFSFL